MCYVCNLPNSCCIAALKQIAQQECQDNHQVTDAGTHHQLYAFPCIQYILLHHHVLAQSHALKRSVTLRGRVCFVIYVEAELRGWSRAC
jgi:hypothetical protein